MRKGIDEEWLSEGRRESGREGWKEEEMCVRDVTPASPTLAGNIKDFRHIIPSSPPPSFIHPTHPLFSSRLVHTPHLFLPSLPTPPNIPMHPTTIYHAPHPPPAIPHTSTFPPSTHSFHPLPPSCSPHTLIPYLPSLAPLPPSCAPHTLIPTFLPSFPPSLPPHTPRSLPSFLPSLPP
ncbi:hypothetical protein Pcinc_004371 [Petrolisthes cinctipes]|uniref:Uncharacterized protein n=1 Tax=Petrolisthes cinctipes TaxID=88211 RepID=A0AAE1GFF8_PETCI|nr:hypothetical protein Pcinc_004371 [Petrolisthes cinctipes]